MRRGRSSVGGSRANQKLRALQSTVRSLLGTLLSHGDQMKLTVIPPPELPHPPAKAFAVPTTFLSKKPVDQTWQGTNAAPKIPMKKRRTMIPVGVVTRPAIAVGRAPARRQPTNTRRGPNLSHRGPAIRRTTRVPVRPMMLELAYWFWLILRSFRIVSVNSGGNAYLSLISSDTAEKRYCTYHERKAIMKPDQEKKNVRPYLLSGLRIGIERAFLLIGFTCGAAHR
jgi:hypothetical protein